MNAIDAGIKPGDEVAIVNEHIVEIERVGRVTKTQIAVGPRNFLRRNGRRVGAGELSRTRFEYPVTDEHRERAELHALRRKVVSMMGSRQELVWVAGEESLLRLAAALEGLRWND